MNEVLYPVTINSKSSLEIDCDLMSEKQLGYLEIEQLLQEASHAIEKRQFEKAQDLLVHAEMLSTFIQNITGLGTR